MAQVSLCQDTENGCNALLSPLQLLLLIPFKQDLTFLFSISSVQSSSVSRLPGIVHSGTLNIASLQDPIEMCAMQQLCLGDDREPSMTLVKILRPVVRGGHAEPDVGSQSLYRMDGMFSLEHPLRSLVIY